MNRFARRVLYGRGLNIAGNSYHHIAQLNPSRVSIPKFEPIEEMEGVAIKKLGCGFLQSYYLLCI